MRGARKSPTRVRQHPLESLHSSGDWQSPLFSWEEVCSKFKLSNERYEDYEFLCFMDINDPFVINYVQFNLGNSPPNFEGRLQYHSGFYKSLNAPKPVQDIVESGLKIPFLTIPPKIYLPNNKSSIIRERRPWVRQTLKEYESLGFISRVSCKPYCVLPLQVAEHPDKLSLIHDESVLNNYVEKQKFKLEGWEKVFEYSKNAFFGVKFDLKKFYYHIPIHADFKKYFGFSYIMDEEKCERVYFVWNVMPYGYTRAPLIARDLMKPLILHWRKLCILVCVYFDDGICVADNFDFAKKCSLQIQCDLLRAGLFPGLQKCIWKPTVSLDWVGINWDFENRKLSITSRRIENLLFDLQNAVKNWPKLTIRSVSKILGKLNSMHPVLEGKEQIHSRMLQTFVNIRHYENLSWDNIISSSYEPLFHYAKSEILFWIENLTVLNFRFFEPKLSDTLGWVDASKNAIGGIVLKSNEEIKKRLYCIDDLLTHTEHNSSARIMHVDYVRSVVDTKLNDTIFSSYELFHRNLSNSEIETDSNERELKAGLETVFACQGFLKNSSLTLHFDNCNAASIFKTGSSKPRLQKYALMMSEFCSKNAIVLNTVAIPRSANKLADQISKCIDLHDYSVSDEFFQRVQKDTGVICNVDRFANNLNTKLRVFNSITSCLGTAGVNAFNYDWAPPFVNWLFPPPDSILQTVNKLKLCKGIGLLVAPEWKSSAFYPLLHVQRKLGFASFLSYSGKNIFVHGIDKNSYFGPEFNAAVNIWILDFRA